MLRTLRPSVCFSNMRRHISCKIRHIVRGSHLLLLKVVLAPRKRYILSAIVWMLRVRMKGEEKKKREWVKVQEPGWDRRE